MNESITEVATITRVVRPPPVCSPICVATFPVSLDKSRLERWAMKCLLATVGASTRRTPPAQLAPDDEAREIDRSGQLKITLDDLERALRRAHGLRQPSPRFCIGQHVEVSHQRAPQTVLIRAPDSKRARKRARLPRLL